MKILHTVEFYWPSIGGAQEVVRQISEHLARMGHDVTVATTKMPQRKSFEHNEVKIIEFDISGNAVRGYEGPDTEKYQRHILESDYDVIMNYAAQQWATDLCLPLLEKIKAKKFMVPCGFSGLFDSSYKTYYEKMPGRLKQYDATVYLSRDYRDINFAKKHGLKNTLVIPNGADENEFNKPAVVNIKKILRIPADHFLILTVGSHTGLKGHVEAIKIFEQADIEKATLLIVANKFDGGCYKYCRRQALKARVSAKLRRHKKRLLIKDLSRELTVAAYIAADLFLFPSNIEASPLVLFEAMAAGTPFLTTDVGNAKEIIGWSGGGKLLPTKVTNEGLSFADIGQSAEMLTELKDSNKGKELAESGRKAWQEKFTWEIISRKYEKLYSGDLKA